MKQDTDKTKKQRESSSKKTVKPSCGTLSYLAECRGAVQKTDSTRWAAPPHGMNRIVRK